MPKLILKKLYNKHYSSILVTFLGETEHFSGKIEALRWDILVGKQKHNVQKPTVYNLTLFLPEKILNSNRKIHGRSCTWKWRGKRRCAES